MKCDKCGATNVNYCKCPTSAAVLTGDVEPRDPIYGRTADELVEILLPAPTADATSSKTSDDEKDLLRSEICQAIDGLLGDPCEEFDHEYFLAWYIGGVRMGRLKDAISLANKSDS